MKLNYLLIDPNNGHCNTYHPFSSNTVLSPERVSKWLNEIPGSGRMGAGLEELFNRLDAENIPFEEFKCPCCETIIREIGSKEYKRMEIVLGINWIKLDGVSGNY